MPAVPLGLVFLWLSLEGLWLSLPVCALKVISFRSSVWWNTKPNIQSTATFNILAPLYCIIWKAVIIAVILDIKKNHIKKDLKELYYKRNHVKDQKIQVECFSQLIYYKLALIGRPNWSQFFLQWKLGLFLVSKTCQERAQKQSRGGKQDSCKAMWLSEKWEPHTRPGEEGL